MAEAALPGVRRRVATRKETQGRAEDKHGDLLMGRLGHLHGFAPRECRGADGAGSAREDGRMRFLLVEDDEDTARYVTKGLGERGHVVDRVADGRSGLFQAGEVAYDALVVDRMLPGLDGLSLVRVLREAGVKTPVLFLTALGGLDDRVAGREGGGDDYLAKPFAFSELLARLNALARRPPPAAGRAEERAARRRPRAGRR